MFLTSRLGVERRQQEEPIRAAFTASLPLYWGGDNGHVFSGVKRSSANATGMLPEFSGSTEYATKNAKVFLSRLPVASIVFLSLRKDVVLF